MIPAQVVQGCGVDSMAFVRTGLIIVALVLGWTAVRAEEAAVPMRVSAAATGIMQ